MSTQLATIDPRQEANRVQVTSAFGDVAGFEAAQRIATALASSSIVPADYRGNVPNCIVAMEYAHRIGASVLAVMQHLAIIQGRPSLGSSFLIATVNASGRFTPIRFRWVGTAGKDDWGCYAVATDKATKEECVGTTITLAMVKAEGWYSRKGSKWPTLTTQMFMYRAAAFWTRIFAPELSLGMDTVEEATEIASLPSSAYADADLNERLAIASAPADEGGATENGVSAEEVEHSKPERATTGQVDEIRTLLQSPLITEEERHRCNGALSKGMSATRAEETLGWLSKTIAERDAEPDEAA